MSRLTRSSLWRTLPIARKLAAIPALFVVAITGMILYTIVTAREQLSDAVVIDVAGRQRSLNQRHLTQLILSGRQGAPQQGDRQAASGSTATASLHNLDYATTRALLNETLESLLNGGSVRILLTEGVAVVPGAPTDAIRQALIEERQALDAFAAKGDEFIKLDSSEASYRAKLEELQRLNYEVEVEANEVVKLFTVNSQSKITAMIGWEAAIGLLVAVLGSVCSWLAARGIISGLGSVVGVAQRIAEGDLRAQKVTNIADDEVGQLAQVVNGLLDTLRELTGQTVTVTGNLNAASAEILASTQQQAAGTKQQATTVQEITSTMEEVRQSGAQIVDRARQVATTAEGMAQCRTSGLRAVEQTNCTMEAIREQVEEVAEKIVALSEQTQAVGEIVATVNDIAERSNLLALNAAIEAAAAGDQGNRFSVVAAEMKNLADQAKDSTVQVRSILGDIQKGINSSVMLTEEAVKRVEAGKQQSDVAEQTIRQMAETTVESIEAFQQIIGATNQQQIGFAQVTQGMQEIRQSATQTAASTSQLERAVASLNAQSQQLRGSVGRYQL